MRRRGDIACNVMISPFDPPVARQMVLGSQAPPGSNEGRIVAKSFFAAARAPIARKPAVGLVKEGLN
jgi:hypothetical protein